MTKINTNSFCKRSTVSSAFFPDTRETIVSVIGTDGKEYRGKTKWNPADPFDPQIGFKIALERAIANMPKPTIIEQCGGLRNGDWVCVKETDSVQYYWGLVCDRCIYYMINSGGWDSVCDFEKDGKTLYSEIVKVIRGKEDIVTLNEMKWFIKNSKSKPTPNAEVYTID